MVREGAHEAVSVKINSTARMGFFCKKPSTTTQASDANNAYNVNLEYPRFLDVKEPNYTTKNQVILSQNEVKLIKELADNPIKTNVAISNIIGVDPRTVKYLRENLINKKVLVAVRPSVNSNKIGFITKHLFLKLDANKYHKRDEIVTFLLAQKYTMFLSLFLNSNALSGELVFKDLDEFRSFERSIFSDFEHIVKKIDYLDKFEEIHYTYLPDGL